jgi:hypothetical protein
VITEVLHTRRTLLERQPQDAAAWRRLTVTERTQTDIARLNGRAIQSVRLAAGLLADRRARLGDLVHADTAEARSILGQALLAAGHPAVARRHLEEAADTRRGRFLPTSTKAGPPLPAHGWTLVLLARAAARLGDTRRAAECFALVTSLATAGIDSCHPVILTAHYDEAMRCAALGDTSRAAKLLEPVLDRTLLAHGWPALSDAHPLLAKARALAERLGITVPYAPAGLDEASLDIDA